jgi:hypothetical protein
MPVILGTSSGKDIASFPCVNRNRDLGREIPMICSILDRIWTGMTGGIARGKGGKVATPPVPLPLGNSRKSSWAVIFAGGVWLSAVATSSFLMLAYANSPGVAGSPPSNWPDSSRVPLDTKLPTLIMFVHPHCPCSRASIGELALLMAHSQGRVSAHVFFLKPPETPADWAQTGTWREAAVIPGIAVHEDKAGFEANLFHSETSGDVVLYNGKGKLIFHGGITSARAHSGDNAGRSTVQALLLNEPVRLSQTSVFGCSLFKCQTNQ